MSKPVFGVGEWAAHSENLYVGCEHGCVYCYARASAATRQGLDPRAWMTPHMLKRHAKGFKFRKYDGTVMFPTTHDITPSNIDDCARYLAGMLAVGNRVLIVTKPHRGCVETLCASLTWARHQVMFRFTIGSASDDVLGFWEPNAPRFIERMGSLERAAMLGFATSISCEPMLDAHIGKVVEAVRPYVSDAIWLGRANYLVSRVAANGGGDTELKAARELAEQWNDDAVRALYERYKNDPKIRWKESIKKVIGLAIPTKKGMDV